MERKERHAVIWMVIYIVSAVVIALAFCSCKTKIVTVEKVHDVYHNVTDTIRDSIKHEVGAFKNGTVALDADKEFDLFGFMLNDVRHHHSA